MYYLIHYRSIALWASCIILFGSCAITKEQTRAEKITDLDNLVTAADPAFITDRLLDSLLIDNMYSISGTNIKEGKSAASAATIDEKSATVTLSFQPCKEKMFFLQPVFTATASDGLVDIFSEGKYSRTLSGGLNGQLFLNSKIANPTSQAAKKIDLHNQLRLVRRQYEHLAAGGTTEWNTDILLIQAIYTQHASILHQIDAKTAVPLSTLPAADASQIQLFYTTAKKLVAAGVITEADLKAGAQKVNAEVAAFTIAKARAVYEERMLKIADSLQYHFEVKKIIKWWSGGVLYNNQPKPIQDTSKRGKPETFYNEYPSFKVAFNRLSLRPSGSGWYFSPNLTLSSSRYFKDADKKTLNYISQITVGGVPADRIDSTFSFFDKKPDRKFAWAVEVPFLYYWKSSKLGLDIAVHLGENDPKGDNVGARIGLYVPVGTKDESVVSVEPLLRIQKLFADRSAQFLRDNLAFGFNVSVAIPAFFSSKSK